MTSRICLDSGIVLKLVLREEDSQQARDFWQYILEEGYQPVAPALFAFELTAVLRKYVYREVITREYSLAALKKLFRLNVQLTPPNGLHLVAWEFASRLDRPTGYDAYYLALANLLDCPFWTADLRLYDAAHSQLPWVHYLGHFQAE